MSNKCGTEYPIVGENPFLKYLINGDGFYCEKVVAYYGHDFQGSVILLFTKVSEAIRNGSRRIGPRGPTVRGPIRLEPFLMASDTFVKSKITEP